MMEWLVNNGLKSCGRMLSCPDFGNIRVFVWEDCKGHADNKEYFVCTNLRPLPGVFLF
jgi:hypothetical protein